MTGEEQITFLHNLPDAKTDCENVNSISKRQHLQREMHV